MLEQFIIYGAGLIGKQCFELCSYHKKADHIYGFCDRAYQQIKSIENKKVFSYKEAKELNLPFLIAILGKSGSEVQAMLEADHQQVISYSKLADMIGIDLLTFNREFIAKFHIEAMDGYFESAESESSLHTFWGGDSPFFRMFQKLDLSHVIELACGRGRHVPQYIDRAGYVTLVDILQKNIDFCQQRFSDKQNISYYCNNGYNLEKLKSGQYSALFSYDAVVHFEMMDIFSYLNDIHRVLSVGGLALIHHSNNHGDYKASFETSIGGRSFMSKNIFAYLAYHAGFEVVEQQIIDWGEKDWDCISLIKKNG